MADQFDYRNGAPHYANSEWVDYRSRKFGGRTVVRHGDPYGGHVYREGHRG